jgi:hypothetical protein
VGRSVVAPDIGLELDDPPDAAAGDVIPDEPGADQRSRGLEAGTFEQAPVDEAQPARG